jgi:glyoxylase-like metal-dependent hydrolase (beta-lactamase superfamily II)
MALTHSFSIGSLRCHTLEAGLQRLDGGAMFGVVPRTLWARRIAPDDRNRIPLAMRCLLVEHPDGLVLIDTGLGNKEDPKFIDIYGAENTGNPGPTQLEDALRELGYGPGDIRWVINTHLHFDHAGGNTTAIPLPGGGTEVRLTFPQATYLVQRGDLDFARHTNERTRASYLPHNFEPVAAAGKFRLLEGDGDVLPGIRVRVTPGHVPHHQSVLVSDGADTLVFLADLIPTSAHLPLPWIMGYDVEPLRTLESRRALLREAVAGGWLLLFEHDPRVAYGRAVEAKGGAGLVDEVLAPGAGPA